MMASSSTDALSRRAWLGRTLALSVAGVPAWDLSRRVAVASPSSNPRRANSCVFVFLFGGPSQVDLLDMKPAAPIEIRGEFQPIATNVPGIEICEHLPRLAQQAHRYCLLRSMTHRMPVHGPACSEIYSGREYFGAPITDQARPDDWPSIASLVQRYGPQRSILPPSVVLPWYSQFVGQDKRIAGQTGGRMGEQFNPFLVAGDPTEADFRIRGLDLPSDVSGRRFARRKSLRTHLEPLGLTKEQSSNQTRLVESNFLAAAELVERADALGAFDLSREPAPQRDAYGRSKFGQSLLLTRRLVEAGVPLVTVNWDDEHKDDKVSPHWDTHTDNFPKLKDRLCPPFDQGLAAFLSDLDERGLLETTLVVVIGEFGRTPRVGFVSQNGMTSKTGRDHWPHAFSAIVAGGGVRGGQVYGSTTGNGGHVIDNPVTPADLSATILAHLGIDPAQEYDDHFLQIRQRLSIGQPVKLTG